MDVDPERTRDTERQRTPHLYVGVGASAGGLEALELLFHDMPADTGVAFIVQQHLSPDFESRMEELLGRETALRVLTAQHGMLVEADTIYLAPPKVEMILAEGALLLTAKDRDQGFSLPIDHFFRSLAQDAGPRAVGIILSGTGSDGSRGIKDIATCGGLVIVQNLESARFDGMPKSAIATGLVTHVIEPAAMATELINHARDVSLGKAHEVPAPVREEGVAEILRLLRGEYGIDFNHYKPSTVMRRVERRIRMADSVDIEDYGEYLRTHRDELSALYKDLLIGVTRFFRDKEAFRLLETEVVPKLLEEAHEELRIWCAGCATGEEPYSIAMMMLEAAGDRPPPFKIFATDVHRASLETASNGRYHCDALIDVSDERRERWFRADGPDHVRVTKELREHVVFAAHNLLTDAPFTRLNLITCRNLLIYFQPAAQAKVLSLFHFGLRTNGTLFLGPSETPGPLEDEFEAINKSWRLYKKRRDIRLVTDSRVPLVASQLTGIRRTLNVPNGRNAPIRDNRLLGIYDLLLARHMPPALLIDDTYQLVHSFGGAEDLLRVRPGRLSTNILDLLDPDLKSALSGALERARRDNQAVAYSGLRAKIKGEERQVHLEVEPLELTAEKPTEFLIVFRPVGPAIPVRPPTAADADAEKLTRDYIVQLEGDLRFTQENLQATVEELETANEELQATNEELVASNEELQSTNEELHSVNEELQTVNVEHQRKIDQLTELTDDMDNLLQSIDIGVLFLDDDLRVREFTAAMASTFHLLRQDRGRPFNDFSHHLVHPSLLADIDEVRRTRKPQSCEVTERGGGVRLLRILPYRSRHRSGGVVLTMVDVSSLRRAEANVRRLSSVVEHASDAIFREDVTGTITDWNAAATKLFGWEASEICGRSVALLVDGDRRQEMLDIHARVQAGDSFEDHETSRLHKSGRRVDVALTVSPVRDERDAVNGASTIARDITRRRRAEEVAHQAVEQRERFLALLSHELRNPLAALLSAAELLDQVDGSARTKRAAEVIQRQVIHTSHLLEDLLDLSRTLHGRMQIHCVPMDLRDIVGDALDEVRSRAQQAGLELVVKSPPTPIVVRGDVTRLKQMLANLLGNAIKYSRADGKVELEMLDDPRGAVVRVTDRGVGIDPDQLELLFQPFYQGPGGSVGGGLGLGLALVRAIATAHGGSARAYSDGPGRGSVFEVVLPREPGLEIPAEPPAEPEPEVVHAPAPRLDGKHVLLVEDQEDNRYLIGLALGDAGYQVTEARSVAEALAALANGHPACAIVDISLPDGDGKDVARKLRAMPGGNLVRMIAMTGHGRQSDREEILAAGFDSHLVKPVAFATLFSELEDNGEN